MKRERERRKVQKESVYSRYPSSFSSFLLKRRKHKTTKFDFFFFKKKSWIEEFLDHGGLGSLLDIVLRIDQKNHK